MASLLNFPDKYHIVWLDAHIGNSEFCTQLKRTFFTHVDPDSNQVVRFSDQDIDTIIDCQSEIPVNFDSFHFTLKAFNEEEACLKYIDKIQKHRILFISSSKLGESAVKKLLERYSDTFTNAKTKEPYDSIYIFCTDVASAAQWAYSYYEYVKIFNFEADLLQRITRDLAEESLDHGQQLLTANETEVAIERLSWAKNLFIRYDNLTFPSVVPPKESAAGANMCTEQDKILHYQPLSNQQGTIPKKIIEIDRLLADAEERRKKQQQQEEENDSAHDEWPTLAISNQMISPTTDHVIVWLDELLDSCKATEATTDCERDPSHITSTQRDNSNHQYLAQLKQEMKTCFFNMPESVVTFDNIDACCQYISAITTTQTIFLIAFSSVAHKILTHSTERWNSIKSVYLIDDYSLEHTGFIRDHRKQNIPILLFDLYKNLLIRILQDISKHYFLKAIDHRSQASSAPTLAMMYFDWAKETSIRAKQLADNDFTDHLNNIQMEMDETKKLATRIQCTDDDIVQQMQMCSHDEDLESVVMIFIIGLQSKLIHLNPGIGRLITCRTNDQLMLSLSNVQLVSPILVVSSTLPSSSLLSFKQLLHYFYFSKEDGHVQYLPASDQNMSYVYSIDQLISELYHKLGQHYRDCAVQASFESSDQHKPKHLLQKSTQCYQLLECDTEKTLKRYAEMLRKTKI